MSINTLDVKLVDNAEEIRKFKWKEVTTTQAKVSNTTELHPEGLYSETIFGKIGTNERKMFWGYISLNDVFMNPHAYYILSSIKKSFASDMMAGTGRYYVDHAGEIQKIDESKETLPKTARYGIGTGFDWLRDAWPHINWKISKDMSTKQKTMRQTIKNCTIGQLFWEQMLVMPAFYRDIDPNSNKRNEINKFYNGIIARASTLKHDTTLVIDPDTPLKSPAHISLQQTINAFYEEQVMKHMGGSHGFANEHVLGKATDYGARLVISTPDYNVNHYKDAESDFFSSSTPLAVAINIFAPFIIYGMTQWLLSYVSGSRTITYFDALSMSFVRADIDETYMDEFTPDDIRKYMSRYKNSKKFRVEPVTLRGEDGKRIPIVVYINTIEIEGNNRNYASYATTPGDIKEFDPAEAAKSVRYLTWCELFYIIAHNTIKDKVIYNTRYPMETYNGTYCSKMTLIPANKYQPVFFNGNLLEKYPILDIESEGDIDRLFTDTMRMCSVFLGAMGADYDGDQISTQGLFCKEGTEDALKHMKSVKNVVGISAQTIRDFPHVINHGIYGLTYKTQKPKEGE